MRLAILSALLVTLAHPFAVRGFDSLADAPNGLLAWIALVPWWLAVRDAPPREAFRLTWITANGFFLGTIFWTVVAMHRFGGLSLPLSVVLLVALCAFIGCFPAAGAWLAARSGHPVWTIAVTWAAAEWLRGIVLTGFPWSHLAYTQWKMLPFIQSADLFGIHGIGALIVLVNVAIAETIRGNRRPLALASSLFVLNAGYGLVRGGRIALDESHGHGARIALVQGNVSQTVKHDPKRAKEIRDLYAAQLIEAQTRGADLVVWPEASIPGGVHVRSTVLTDKHLPYENTAWLLSGVATYWHEEKKLFAHNSAILVAPNRRVAATYHKSHLVPFGEYVPLGNLLFFVRKMTKAAGFFLPGEDVAPIDSPFGALGMLICYEDVFPEISRELALAGAGILVNITNDAWYGRSSAPYQHLAIAVFRAVETRRPLVRAAQTGISGVVEPNGAVRDRTTLFTGPTIVEAAVAPRDGLTPYVRFGDVFAAACLGATLAMLFETLRHRPHLG